MSSRSSLIDSSVGTKIVVGLTGLGLVVYLLTHITGNLLGTGLGNPSPSLVVVLRKTAGGGQIPIKVDLNRALCDPRERILVQPGDLLILQETPCEAFVRYLSLTFRFNFFGRIFERQDAFLTNTATLP